MNSKISALLLAGLAIIKLMAVHFKMIKYSGFEHGALAGAGIVLALNVVIHQRKKNTKRSYKNISFSKI